MFEKYKDKCILCGDIHFTFLMNNNHDSIYVIIVLSYVIK